MKQLVLGLQVAVLAEAVLVKSQPRSNFFLVPCRVGIMAIPRTSSRCLDYQSLLVPTSWLVGRGRPHSAGRTEPWSLRLGLASRECAEHTPSYKASHLVRASEWVFMPLETSLVAVFAWRKTTALLPAWRGP